MGQAGIAVLVHQVHVEVGHPQDHQVGFELFGDLLIDHDALQARIAVHGTVLDPDQGAGAAFAQVGLQVEGVGLVLGQVVPGRDRVAQDQDSELAGLAVGVDLEPAQPVAVDREAVVAGVAIEGPVAGGVRRHEGGAAQRPKDLARHQFHVQDQGHHQEYLGDADHPGPGAPGGRQQQGQNLQGPQGADHPDGEVGQAGFDPGEDLAGGEGGPSHSCAGSRPRGEAGQGVPGREVEGARPEHQEAQEQRVDLGGAPWRHGLAFFVVESPGACVETLHSTASGWILHPEAVGPGQPAARWPLGLVC